MRWLLPTLTACGAVACALLAHISVALTLCAVALSMLPWAAVAVRGGGFPRWILLLVSWSISAGLWLSWTWRPDPLFAGFGILCAANAWLASRRSGPEPEAGWGWLGVAWFLASVLLLLATGYGANDALIFFVGWSLAWVGLATVVRWRKLPYVAVQLILGVLLLMLALPFVDAVLRREPPKEVSLERKLYSFSAAKKDPAAFARWWNYYREAWDRMGSEVFKPDPTGRFPLRLREGAQGRLMESTIRINAHGFRGAELSRETGDIFRVVCLGESTTFGCTLREGDRPWPEILEELLNKRLDLARRVEVINAGVPAYTLTHHVQRLAEEILPLRPDVVLSYHGYNGFRMLDGAIPPSHGKRPPAYRPRPIKLLADAEQRLRLSLWKRGEQPARPVRRQALDPLETAYGAAYAGLIEACRTNALPLVLATFSMAVRGDSRPEVIEFYRSGFPSVYAQIAANEVHNELVVRLQNEAPETALVDTRPWLDGQHEKFIDLIHLTQEGRNNLAEAFFEKLRPMVKPE